MLAFTQLGATRGAGVNRPSASNTNQYTPLGWGCPHSLPRHLSSSLISCKAARVWEGCTLTSSTSPDDSLRDLPPGYSAATQVLISNGVLTSLNSHPHQPLATTTIIPLLEVSGSTRLHEGRQQFCVNCNGTERPVVAMATLGVVQWCKGHICLSEIVVYLLFTFLRIHFVLENVTHTYLTVI